MPVSSLFYGKFSKSISQEALPPLNSGSALRWASNGLPTCEQLTEVLIYLGDYNFLDSWEFYMLITRIGSKRWVTDFVDRFVNNKDLHGHNRAHSSIWDLHSLQKCMGMSSLTMDSQEKKGRNLLPQRNKARWNEGRLKEKTKAENTFQNLRKAMRKSLWKKAGLDHEVRLLHTMRTKFLREGECSISWTLATTMSFSGKLENNRGSQN